MSDDKIKDGVIIDLIEDPIVQDSLRRFDMAQKSQYEIRLRCLQDRRFVFVDGAQWEDALRLQFDNKPRFEINKLHLAVIRIFNEYRANRVTVKFEKADDDADDHTAEFLQGIHRADEKRSGGSEAYDNAFEEGTAGGFGAWRLTNVFVDDEDEEDEKQKIVFEPIYDADRFVFWDLGGKKYDKSDAQHCWVLTAMGRAEFSEKYGDSPNDPYNLSAKYTSSAQSMGLGRLVTMTEFDWYTPDVVYIVEYYRIEETKKKIHIFRPLGQNTKARDIKVDEEDLKPEEDGADPRKDLEDQGYTHVRTRTVRRKRVRKWIHDGARVLEDCGYIAGPNIPIVPFYGKRAWIDNQERIQGHIRNGKDSQRLLNMQVSLLAIISALSPRAKPVFTPDEIRGHEMAWADDNINDNPFLLRNAFDAGDGSPPTPLPLQFTQPPNVPPALAAMIEMTNADIKELMGGQEEGEKVVSNISDALMERVQSKIDMQAFIYIDNFAKSMERSGQIWLGMAKEIYDEDNRLMVSIGPDGKRSHVRLKQPRVVDGVTQTVNDPMKGKFDVTVDTGPAFKSKREATVRALVSLLQFVQDPQLVQIITSLIMANMDGEGLEDVREFMRMRLVNLGVVKPTEAEQKKIREQQQQAANQPPSPQDQLVMAETQRLQAETAKTGAEIEKTHAESIAKLSGAADGRAKAIADLANHNLDKLRLAHELLQTLLAQTGEDAQAAGNASPGSSQAAQVASQSQ
jgi:hypothetical protein